jgi:hypothetical protein
MTDDDIEKNEKGSIPPHVLRKANDRAREAEARAEKSEQRASELEADLEAKKHQLGESDKKAANLEEKLRKSENMRTILGRLESGQKDIQAQMSSLRTAEKLAELEARIERLEQNGQK